ncbi:MAG: hypothetical protein KatS3mg108_1745 [Isosphaeraceae bacterium]|jgi:carbon storage regulator|nr:MAG: hypothetical protein KatS3mg108_1745 [Isosphaeraceae bacterium]
MLVLTRKVAEKLYIGDGISVTVLRIGGGQVRLGIEAPADVAIVRGELRDRERGRLGTSSSPAQLEVIGVSRKR